MFGSNNGDATRVKYTEKSLKTTLGFLFHVSSIHAFRILANFSPLRVRFLLAHLNNRETWLNSHDSRVSKTNHFVKWRRNGIRTILFLFLPSFRAYRARTELITWKWARRTLPRMDRFVVLVPEDRVSPFLNPRNTWWWSTERRMQRPPTTRLSPPSPTSPKSRSAQLL